MEKIYADKLIVGELVIEKKDLFTVSKTHKAEKDSSIMRRKQKRH